MRGVLLFVLVCVVLVLGADEDPSPVSYPGQVNVGLLADMRTGGTLKKGAVERAMAAVWAAAKENYGYSRQLNIGVTIFDTCGETAVAERQAYRLLGHVVTDKRPLSATPIFGVVSDGDAADFAAGPGRLLDAFGVPVVTASAQPTQAQHLTSTAADTATLATVAVSVLQHLRLLEVALMAEDVEGGLFAEFSRQAARVSGMKVAGAEEVEDTIAALSQIAQQGKSPVKAVVFLLSTQEAERLLSAEDDNSPLPWLVVTPEHVTPPEVKRQRKILLLSPESTDINREFDAYFRQLLEVDTAKYHPLLQEYLNDTAHNNSTDSVDVSSVVRAVRLLASALRHVQSRDCLRRSTDCPSRMRPEAVKEALRQQRGLRYVLRQVDEGGDVTEVGFYMKEGGLQLYDDLKHFHLNLYSSNSRWNIFDEDRLHPTTLQTEPVPESILEDDFLLVHGDDFHLQSLDNSSASASNMRSVSLTSHHENQEPLPKEEGVDSAPSVFRHAPPIGAWLGRRPWALGVLGTSLLISLAVLYAIVFLLVRACEGGGAPLVLPVLQLASLSLLCVGAGLHAFSPNPFLCAIRGAVTNCALAFCYGGLLLRGMHVRSVGVLGLGGRVSRLNQLLTLALAVGGQVALESRLWPADCSDPINSSIYYGVLLLAATVLAAAANRRSCMSVPFGRREIRALLCSALCCLLLFGAWSVSRLLLPDSGPPLSIARSALLLGTALSVLVGLALGTPPKRHKRPLSYADSLSTVFTLFSKEDGGGGSTTGRGRTKTLEKATPSYGENLLYSDYQSAYP